MVVPRRVIRERVKILFIAANSRGDQQLALGEELRRIERAVRESRYRDAFDVVSELAVRQRDLQRVLLRHRPDIVHFACHGSRDAELVLLRDDGTSGPVPAATLASYFRILRNNIVIVVMNACFSGEQAAAVRTIVDLTIGMHLHIADEGAISFSEAFYQGLGYGCSVRDAFDLGTTAIGLSRPEEAGAPLLFERDGIDAATICLAGERPPRKRSLSAGLRPRVWLASIGVVVGIATWRWLPTGAAGSAGTARGDAVAGSPAIDRPSPLDARGMVWFTGAQIRPGVFGRSQRPAECPALPAEDDCALQREADGTHQSALQDFWLDAYEVTSRDFAAWLNEHRDTWRRNASDPSVLETRGEPSAFLVRTGPLCGLEIVAGRVLPVADGARRPAICMTWIAARDYCLGHPDRKRLPFQDEWEFAAKGLEGRAFPWGELPPHPDRVAFRRGRSTVEHPVDVGISTQDVSPQGIHDLGANVAEWVDDRSAPGARKPIRGGSWNSSDPCRLLGSGCKRIEAESFSRDVGFRCARTR